MDPMQWQEMQLIQAENEAINKVEVYRATLFESNQSTLLQWYGEALSMQDGFAPSAGLADFLTAPGRGIGEDAPMSFYAEAIALQLDLAGVDLKEGETALELARIIAKITNP